MTNRFVLWRRLALLNYGLLIVLVIYWYLINSFPQHTLGGIFVAMYIAILLLPVTQLLKNNPRVYLWSGYLILIYFTHAVIETYANRADRWLAVTELFLSLIYFISVTFCYRYSRK